MRLFADDTRILKEITCSDDVANLQEDLSSVSIWALHNNMVLHEHKFDLIVHKANPRSELCELPRMIESYTYNTLSGITNCTQPILLRLKDLGVLVSPDLSRRPQVSAVASKSRSVASLALSVFRARDRTLMLTLYKSLVRSHLEYCCPLGVHQKQVTSSFLKVYR